MMQFNYPLESWQRWLLTGLILSVSIWVIHGALSKGIADFYRFPVDKITRQLEKQGHASLKSIERGQRLIAEAVKWDKKNPYLLIQQANLFDWRAGQTYFWEYSRDLIFRRALELYQTAASLRPVSAMYWIKIALMKVRLGEFDLQLEQSMHKAARLGPWEPLVQIQLSEIGLSIWPTLPPKLQAVVIENIRRGLLRKSRFIVASAERHNKIPLLCQKLGDEPQLRKKCRG